MTDITVRKGSGSPLPSMSRVRDSRPLRMLRNFFHLEPRDLSSPSLWDPFQEMAPMLDELTTAAFLPAFEVKEVKDAYLFKADLPGVKESDLEVSITGNRLTVAGSRNEEHEEKAETYYSCECSYGSFNRSFTLPEGADVEHIHADLKSGVLTVAVPKRPEAQAKKIAVKSANVKA